MNKHFFKLRLLVLGIGMFLAMIAVFSVAVMLLWNALMPDIFGLPALNYWQAVGMVVLARILFGGLGGGFHGPGHGFERQVNNEQFFNRGNALREKWMSMSEDERKEFLHSRRGFSHLHNFFDENEKSCGKDAPGSKGGDNE